MRAAALILLACPALGEGLEGLAVSFTVESWEEDRAAPLYLGDRFEGVVGGGPEFGLDRGPSMNGYDTVPVLVDISAARVDLFYKGSGPGIFTQAAFNGYVMRFDAGDCAVFEGARLDRTVTTLPMAPADVAVEGSALLIDVGGMEFGPTDRIAVEVDVADCVVG